MRNLAIFLVVKIGLMLLIRKALQRELNRRQHELVDLHNSRI